jgi:two-component system, NarL family, response regulator NreC
MRLLLVDDHEVVRSGLRMLLESQEDIQIVGEAGTAAEALEAIERLEPEVILLDIGLPDMSGIQVMERIQQIEPEAAVVALTIHEDKEYFFKMLDAGATGYVPKRAAPDELLTAIRAAAQGQVYLYPSLATLLVKDYLVQDAEARESRKLNGLTERELEVLTHVADGATNAEIGLDLGISPKTVARHRENIMAKLNLHSRTELVKYAIRKGIIKP